MEYNAEIGRFGLGGSGAARIGEPLALIREGKARRLDREWATQFLTGRYVDKSLMSKHNRSNLLAKVYGRLRTNKVGNSRKRLARIWSVSTTSAPNENIQDSVAMRQPAKKRKSTMSQPPMERKSIGENDEIKFGYTPYPPYVLTSKTVTMYNGDVWTRRQYGIGNGPYWSSENWLTAHAGRAASDGLWYCWIEPWAGGCPLIARVATL